MKNFAKILFFPLLSTIFAANIDPEYQWKFIEYEWDSETQKREAKESGAYNWSASALNDVDIADDQRIFVTILRTAGVPATLGTVSTGGDVSTESGGPLIRPYPNWASNLIDNCDGFTNIYQVAIDECNQLWALDSGMIDNEYKCPAKLILFDLESDRVIREIEIPRELYTGVLVTLIVHQVDPMCQKPSVYMADVYGSALVIYDGDENFCRLEADEFKPEPGADTYTIAGDQLTLEVGLVSMALSARDDDDPEDEQILFFRPLSSFSMYRVLASQIRDYCATNTPPDFEREEYIMPSQSTSHTIADDVLFFGYLAQTSLNCWDTYKTFNEKNIGTLDRDEEQLQWISGIKSYPKFNGGLGNVIYMTNKFQDIYQEKIDVTEFNYRIFRINAYVRTYGTVCL